MDLVAILDGSTFVVSDRNGDIQPSRESATGLFALDTRFLSTWILTVNGESLSALSVDDLQYFEARFFLVPGHPAHHGDATVSVLRHRTLGGSFGEELTILNHDGRPADLVVRLEVGSDFADIFEVRDVPAKRVQASADDGRLHLSYERGTFRRDTLVSSSQPARVDSQGLTFEIRVEPYGQWVTRLHVEPLVQAPIAQPKVGTSLLEQQVRVRAHMREDLDRWLSAMPKLVCDYEPLVEAYRRSLTDLAALRYSQPGWPTKLPAAGLPWFMALFGRDSILTSIQALPFAPELARATLGALASIQGKVLDDFREEEPGKSSTSGGGASRLDSKSSRTRRTTAR